MITTITAIPPQIVCTFNKNLLDMDIWGHTANKLILLKLANNKRYKEGGRRDREFKELVALFEELYEWQKAQKVNKQAEKESEKERPKFPTEKINRVRGELGIALRGLEKKLTAKCGINDAF